MGASYLRNRNEGRSRIVSNSSNFSATLLGQRHFGDHRHGTENLAADHQVIVVPFQLVTVMSFFFDAQ